MTTRRPLPRRILHWELNVRDLAASVAFYETLTSLRATSVVDDGASRSTLLIGDAAPLPALRLVEWSVPRAVGGAHDSIAAIGFTRVVLHVADLDATRALAESLGIRPVAATTGDDFRFELGTRGSVSYRVWSCLDPDGIVVEFLASPVPRVSTVAQGTASLAQAVGFLTGTLRLELVDTVATTRPMPNVYLPGGDPVEFRGAFLRFGAAPGYLDVLEHRDAAARRTAYDIDHHVGVIRCALEVAHLDEPTGAVDFGGPLGRRRVRDLRDPEGVRYQLVEGAG